MLHLNVKGETTRTPKCASSMVLMRAMGAHCWITACITHLFGRLLNRQRRWALLAVPSLGVVDGLVRLNPRPPLVGEEENTHVSEMLIFHIIRKYTLHNRHPLHLYNLDKPNRTEMSTQLTENNIYKHTHFFIIACLCVWMNHLFQTAFYEERTLHWSGKLCFFK